MSKTATDVTASFHSFNLVTQNEDALDEANLEHPFVGFASILVMILQGLHGSQFVPRKCMD